MFIESPRLPDSIAYGGTFGPAWRTSVIQMRGQHEQRNQHWAMPLYSGEVNLLNKDVALVRDTFLPFYHAIAQGETHGFRYHDLNPDEDTGTDEPLGVGDGVRTAFHLVKWYAYGGVEKYRIITKPVVGSVTVTLDNVLTVAYTLDTTTGVVTFTVPPGVGVIPRASYLFDVPCQFVMPRMALRQIAPNVWSWPSIQLQEIRTL